jgi:hypothetical protein
MRTRALTSRWAVRACSLSFALAALLLAAAPAKAQGPRNAPAQYTVTDGTIFDRSVWINGRTPSSSELASLRTTRSRSANKPHSTSGQNRNTYTGGGMRRGGMGRGMGGMGGGGGGTRTRVPVYVPPTLPVLPPSVSAATARR